MSDGLRERIARAYKTLTGPHTASDGGPFIRMPTDDEVADAVLAVLRDTPTVCRTCGSDDAAEARLAEAIELLRGTSYPAMGPDLADAVTRARAFIEAHDRSATAEGEH